MKIKGIVVQHLDVVSGENENGEWRRAGFVIETLDERPRKIAFVTKNDRVDMLKPELKGIVEVEFDVSSHEFAGKWYSSLVAYKFTYLK